MASIDERYQNYFINEDTGETTYLPSAEPQAPTRPEYHSVSPGRRLEDPLNVMGYGRTGQVEDPFGVMPGIERTQYVNKQQSALKMADYLAQFLPPDRVRMEVYRMTGTDLGGNVATPNQLKREDTESQIRARTVQAEENQADIAKKRQEMVGNRIEARTSLENAQIQLDRMAEEAGKIKGDDALWRAVGLVGFAPNVPGSAAADVAGRISSLKSQVGFSVLQAMRDASKTGGALGNVSNVELELLQSNLAALSNAQSPAQFRESLQQIIDYTRQSKQRLERGYKDTYSGREPSAGEDRPPAAAVARLQEGIPTKFGNGQVWTLQNGQPKRVK